MTSQVSEGTPVPGGDELHIAARRIVSPIPWQVRLSILAAIWGSSFLLIKVGDEALAPLQVALGRLLFGAAALLVVLALRHDTLPRGWGLCCHLAIAALLLNVLPFTLFAYGETRTTSILAGIWNATTPLFTLVVASVALRGERPSAGRSAGLVLGFAGVLVLLGVWRGLGGSSLLGNASCLAAAVSYGFGFPYARRHLAGRTDSSLALAAGQLLCAAAEVALVIPLFTRPPGTVPFKVVAAVVVLGALGTGVAYILNYDLIREVGATMAATVTYPIPFVSTLEGALVLGEPLTWYQIPGAVLIVLGVVVAQGRMALYRFSR